MKNLKVKTSYLLIAIIILIFNSCKEKDCRKDGTCPPDYRKMPLGEAKNYLWSLPGSYWIYKNTSTGDLDTQICTGFLCDTLIVKGTYNDTKHLTVEYERIRRTISSSFNKWVYYDETGFYNPNSLRPLKSRLERHTDGSYNAPFFHPFIINDIDGTQSSKTTCIGMDSFLTVQGKTYTNVAKFDIDMDDIWYSTQQYPNAIYFWAKDVGLIKRFNKTENFSWELIEYNIIK